LSRATAARMSFPRLRPALCGAYRILGSALRLPRRVPGSVFRPLPTSSVGHLSAPLRPMTGSITRTFERVLLGAREDKRFHRNPELVPTKFAAVPRWRSIVPNPRSPCPQAVPRCGPARRAVRGRRRAPPGGRASTGHASPLGPESSGPAATATNWGRTSPAVTTSRWRIRPTRPRTRERTAAHVLELVELPLAAEHGQRRHDRTHKQQCARDVEAQAQARPERAIGGVDHLRREMRDVHCVRVLEFRG